MIDFAHQINQGAKSSRSAADILSTTLSLDLRQLAVVDNLYFARAKAIEAVAAIQFAIDQRQTSSTPEPADETDFENYLDDTVAAIRQGLTLRSAR